MARKTKNEDEPEAERTDHYRVATHLHLLVSDIDAGKAISDRGIAARFQVKPACARRYRLWVQGQRPLARLRTERGLEWRRAAEARSDGMAPLRASALGLATEALADLEGTHHFAVLRDMADEARVALTEEEDARLLRLTRGFQVRRSEHPRHPGRAHFLEELIRAIDEQVVCDLEHQKGTGDVQPYRIEPWGFLHHKGRLLLVAGKIIEGAKNRERRFFNVDGIRRLTVTRERAAPAPARATDYGRFLRHSFGIWHLPKEPVSKVHLIVRGSIAALLEQRAMHQSQHEERRYDGSLSVYFEVVICPEFRAWVRSLIPDVEIVEPDSLRDELMADAKAWLASVRSITDRSNHI